MPDITKCSGEGCPKSQSCYRYTAEADDYQSFFVTPPIKDKECDHYWKDEPKELMRISGSKIYIDGELVPEDMIAMILYQLMEKKDGKE